ncbi:hypothetical protein F0562_021833 [Nyssa sinensis]|uniref:Uncharacterized protein n=1 Tax=Nyssa sinensis TaxID=561372 RepID=A0A5J5BPC4_9ASTE|nr:hypothetical protein F0562_021833 [Nyssa sinensis]
MESDLSLIEIAGEDDSLLPPVPTLDDTTTTATTVTTYFSCSPLQIPKSKRCAGLPHASPTKGWKDNLDRTKSSSSPRGSSNKDCIVEGWKDNLDRTKSSSSPRGSSNKENINMNKSEVPKLSVELQQMKRRKKGGGYNLRKSLAWDRAFFTEEGVLNPVELSMLSGNFGSSSGEVLSVIHEEGRKSLSGVSNCASDSVHLQALEETLFKEIPETTLNVDREKGGSSLLKHDSSAHDNVASTPLATPKRLSYHTSGTGSKSGVCPQPFSLSSLKRPANSSTTKASLKESKLPKLPVPKPPKVPVPKLGSCSISTGTKSTVLGASHLKHNQMAQSDYAQKNSGLKGDSKNIKSAPNKAKAASGCISLSAKLIAQHPRRNTVDSPLEINSSTNRRPVLVGKANGSLQENPDPVLPPSGAHALEGHDVSRKTGLSSQNTQCIGGNMPYIKFQTTKPSGLRMPSPSLGFFGQPKNSNSQSLPHRTTQPCNLPKSCIPSLKKFGASNYMPELRPLHAPGKMPKVVNDANASENTRVLGLSAECSVPSGFNDASCENMKLNLEVDNEEMVEVNVPCDPKRSEPVKNNEHVHKVIDADKEFEKHAEPDKIGKFFYHEDREWKVNGNEFLLQSGSCDQFKRDSNEKETTVCPEYGDSNGSNLENPKFISQDSFSHIKGIFGSNDTVEHQHIEDKEYSSSVKKHEVNIESQSQSATRDVEQDFSIMHHNSLGNTHVHGQSGEQAELINPSTGEADRISHGENNSLKKNDGILFEDIKPFEKSWQYDSRNIADVNPKCSGFKWK